MQSRLAERIRDARYTQFLDELLKYYKSPEDMFGDDELLEQLTKAAACP
jgi:hypothetical protein